MAKSEKLFEILELIKRDSNLTPKDLAKLCHISERAVYRYLNTLSRVGISVSFQDGGYKLGGDCAHILNDSDPDSLEAIKLLLSEGMKICEDNELLEHGREFVKLINLNLPTEKRQNIREIEIVPERIRATRRGGVITIGHGSKPDILNPILTSESIYANLMSLIFSSLIKFDNIQHPVPDIAHRWEISHDGLVWTFHIRDDVAFHDGQPLTAHDVVFTYSSIMDPRNMSPLSDRYEMIDKFEIEGDFILRIILKHPCAPFVHRLDQPIAPRHLLENVDIYNAVFNRNPVGSGPFKLVEWRNDDTIILDANRQYFRKDRPILDGLIFKTYSHRKAIMEAMANDEMDMALNITSSDFLFLDQSEAFRTYSIDGDSYYALVFNLLDPMFRDIRLRKALDYAIDKETIIKNQLKGYGIVCTGPFHSSSWAHNDKVMPIPHNIENAIALLEASGWKDNNGDGILDKDGKILEISITVPNMYHTLKQIALALKDQLMKIGIDSKLVYTDNPKLYNIPFHAMLTKISIGGDPDYACRAWHSEGGNANIASYKNGFVDNLIDFGKQTANLEKRKAIYHKIHEMIHDDCPAIFLASAYEYIVSKNRFRNRKFSSLAHFVGTMKDWQIVDGNKHSSGINQQRGETNEIEGFKTARKKTSEILTVGTSNRRQK